MTHAEDILAAVARMVRKGSAVFTRNDIRQELGLDPDTWASGYTATFQGMRIDHPGGAPPVAKALRGVFQRVDHGRYKLTSHGEELVKHAGSRPTPKTESDERSPAPTKTSAASISSTGARGIRKGPPGDANLIIYVGDTGDLIKRIRTNHCGGNVEASALRRHVAQSMGLQVKSTRRASGSTRVRIDLPDPREGELQVSAYLMMGRWKYILCDSPAEAKDFQWYAIEKLEPRLNKILRPWRTEAVHRYRQLLEDLVNSPTYTCAELPGMPSGPGVYVLYHHEEPQLHG